MQTLTTGMIPRSRTIAIYMPLPWQIAPWRDKSPILLLTGSAGGGKSRVAGEKLHGYLKKYPGCTGLMLRKAREYGSKSIVPFMQKTVIGSDPTVRMRKVDTSFTYANGSILYWGGMRDDSQREGLRSIGPDGALDIVWIEEANQFTENDFNEILARMRGKSAPWQQVILSCNPDDPNHWINQRLILGGEASVYYSGAKDNPHNPPGYTEFLNKLTGVLRTRLVEGRWSQAEGVVYDGFDPAIHVIEWFKIPSHWPRYRSIDFGYTNPFVCQWWALDDDGRAYLYREIYRTGKLCEDLAKEIKYLSHNENIVQTVADHDAEDRATLERHGVYTVPANKSVSPGIQAVTARLQKAGDGRPRLFILRGALTDEDPALKSRRAPHSTEAEITGYIWQKAPDGKPIKETPLKQNDHGMDAMRYMMMALDKKGVYFA